MPEENYSDHFGGGPLGAQEGAELMRGMHKDISEIKADLAILADYLQAADGALAVIHQKGTEKLSPASFLRAYSQIREEQDAEDAEDGPQELPPGPSPE